MIRPNARGCPYCMAARHLVEATRVELDQERARHSATRRELQTVQGDQAHATQLWVLEQEETRRLKTDLGAQLFMLKLARKQLDEAKESNSRLFTQMVDLLTERDELRGKLNDAK